MKSVLNSLSIPINSYIIIRYTLFAVIIFRKKGVSKFEQKGKVLYCIKTRASTGIAGAFFRNGGYIEHLGSIAGCDQPVKKKSEIYAGMDTKLTDIVYGSSRQYFKR